MNEENEDFNIEEELNKLPGYIKSIINECDTIEKKDISSKPKENSNTNFENKNEEKITDNQINNEKVNKINEDSLNNKKEKDDIEKNNINEDEEIFFDENKENDYNLENIFNSKKDFFNPKTSDDNSNIDNKNNKQNINNENNQNNGTNNSNNAGIKLYFIQENNLMNIKRSHRLQSILQNNVTEYQNNTNECSICYRRIQNYGLLSNCDDAFCYDCIKQWRTEAISKNKREMFRRCPICNCESPMLIKSKNYVSGEEKRKKFYELKQEKKLSQVNQ